MYTTDKAPTQFVVYVYAASQPNHLRDFRCPRCGRVVFRSSSSQFFITNKYGANIQDLPPNSHFQELKCHSCKALYNILYQ